MADANSQGELWGRSPAGWAEVMEPNNAPLWEAMLDATSVTVGTRVLDAGCGGGGASVLADRRGAQVTGLDAAEGLVRIARRRVPTGYFRVGDLQRLPFEDGRFDVAIAANSIQFADDRVLALHELGRVCADGGRVAVGLFGPPERVTFVDVLRATAETLPDAPQGGGPFELSSPGVLESLVEEAGLTVTHVGEADCPFVFPDLETLWQGISASGPVQSMLEVVDQDDLRAAVTAAGAPFVQSDGSLLIRPNVFRYVVATP